MNVLYDFQAFFMQTHGGVSNCFVELIKHLPDDVKYYLGVKESNNIHLLDSNLLTDVKPICNRLESFCNKIHLSDSAFSYLRDKMLFKYISKSRNKQYTIELLKSKKIDVFHPTYYNSYFMEHLNGVPFVLTVHDLIHERFANYYKRTQKSSLQRRELASKAAHIIAVSNTTKEDIIKYWNIDEDKISVIYHAANPMEVADTKPVLDCPYILYVGGRNKYKNFGLFVANLKNVFNKYPDLKLLCTGVDFSQKEKDNFRKYGLSDRIVHYFAKDIDMPRLYRNAKCFVFPSLYEGFGIPILEAYSNNCIVLLNKKSCFPEIAGDAAVYFTLDEQTSDVSEALDRVLQFDEEQRKAQIDKQNERLKLYSWVKSANQLADIYRKVCK